LVTPKARRGFRFSPQLYEDFKGLASENGYTVTAALEKFMAVAVKFGLVFPSAKNETAQAEARVMLAWLKEGKYWVNLGTKLKPAREDAYCSCCQKSKMPN
jgi:hypothetical protein